MTVRRKILNTGGIYFITFTCYNWFPLFELSAAYDEVYKQFSLLASEGHFIIGYVIMPNHIHVLVAFNKKEQNINQRIGAIKRFLAYEIIQRLKNIKNNDMLKLLADRVKASEQRKGKLHQVFEPSFDCKKCYTEKIIIQKLNYIHGNPCKGKWHLAACPADYLYSSAGFYSSGEQGWFPVTHYRDLFELDLIS